jgi:tripartite-type tricarboxylate transporter receptor subunit TctC
LFLPKGTPRAIVERINAEVDRAMREESILKRMAALGADQPPTEQRTPRALRVLVRSEFAKWVPLVRTAGAVGE